MKKIAILIGLLVAIAPLASAKEGLPNPGMIPGNALYGLDRAFEGIQSALTFRQLSRARLHYVFAQERLAEAQSLSDAGNTDLAESTLEEYENELDETNSDLESAVATGEDPTEITDEINEMGYANIEAFRRMYAADPERIERLMQRAMERHSRAIRFVDSQELVDVTITVGNRTVIIQMPETMAARMVEKAERFSTRMEEHIRLRNATDKFENALERCENLIEELEDKNLDNAGQVLLDNAKKHLENAMQAEGNETIGIAYGQIVAACRNAENAAKHIIEERERPPRNETNETDEEPINETNRTS